MSDRMIGLYHITAWQNLPRIIDTGGLFCVNERQRLAITPVPASNKMIMEKRARIKVPLPPGGVLSDYEPFSFAPRSPMLCAIKNGKVEGITQQQMVHLRVGFHSVKSANLSWVFCDGHPTSRLSQFSNNEADFSLVDWSLMKVKQWANTENDGDRSRRRQAEFLIFGFVPWELVNAIGVFNEDTLTRVEACLEGVAHHPPVRVMKTWYYEQ